MYIYIEFIYLYWVNSGTKGEWEAPACCSRRACPGLTRDSHKQSVKEKQVTHTNTRQKKKKKRPHIEPPPSLQQWSKVARRRCVPPLTPVRVKRWNKILHTHHIYMFMHPYIIDFYRVNSRNGNSVRSSCVLFSTGLPVSSKRFAQATYGHKERHEVTVRDGYGLGTTVGNGYQSVRLCAVCAYATLLASVSVLCNVEPSKGNVAYK